MDFWLKLVPMVGFEPTNLAAYGSEPYVFTNFTTSATLKVHKVRKVESL